MAFSMHIDGMTCGIIFRPIIPLLIIVLIGSRGRRLRYAEISGQPPRPLTWPNACFDHRYWLYERATGREVLAGDLPRVVCVQGNYVRL